MIEILKYVFSWTDEDQMQADFSHSLLGAPLLRSVSPMTQMNILSSSSRRTQNTSSWSTGLLGCLLSGPHPEADAVLPPGQASEAVSPG